MRAHLVVGGFLAKEPRLTAARVVALLAAVLGAVVALGLAASAASAATFSNTDAITINDASSTCGATPGLATPSYPSTITVSNSDFPEGSRIGDVNVTVSGLSHPFPEDVGLLLVSPAGKSTLLMADSGGNWRFPLSGVNLTFDDAASGPLPDSTQITSGTYLPTKGTLGPGTPSEGCRVPSSFPAPAPAGPYGSTLSVFNGSDPKGTWQLYVIDDGPIDGGSISGGWSLDISLDTTAPTIQSTSPQDGATKVPITNPNITATFSEAMATIPADSVTLEKVRVKGKNETVLGAVSTTLDQSSPNVVRITPEVTLDKGSHYRVTITTDATDLAGNPLQAEETWRFKTAPK